MIEEGHLLRHAQRIVPRHDDRTGGELELLLADSGPGGFVELQVEQREALLAVSLRLRSGRAVLGGLCEGDVSRFGSLRGRFADQVWPGDEITTKQWFDGDGGAILQVSTDRGIDVLTQASASLRPAT